MIEIELYRLQSVAACCSLLQCVAACWQLDDKDRTLSSAKCCSVLQCVAVRFSAANYLI